jgi:hypothetical protein
MAFTSCLSMWHMLGGEVLQRAVCAASACVLQC